MQKLPIAPVPAQRETGTFDSDKDAPAGRKVQIFGSDFPG
jgi:hypothetical protein